MWSALIWRSWKVSLWNTCIQFGFNVPSMGIQLKNPIINWLNFKLWYGFMKMIALSAPSHPPPPYESHLSSFLWQASLPTSCYHYMFFLIPLNYRLHGQDVFFAQGQYQFVKCKHHEGRDLVHFILYCILVTRTLPVHIVSV